MKFLLYIILCLILFFILLEDIPLVEYVECHTINDLLLSLKEAYNNDDIIGTISVGDINDVIVKGLDNDYYLNHNKYGLFDYKGSIFVDYRTDLDSKIVIIYGHNSINGGTPFSSLEQYYDEYYLKKNNIITVCASNYCNRYEIFSVFVETNDWFYMNLEGSFDEYYKKLLDKSWFFSELELSLEDDLIVLQTCSYHAKYMDFLKKYLIIAGKKA